MENENLYSELDQISLSDSVELNGFGDLRNRFVEHLRDFNDLRDRFVEIDDDLEALSTLLSRLLDMIIDSGIASR